MTRVISEQFEGEEIPKNLRKMLVKGNLRRVSFTRYIITPLTPSFLSCVVVCRRVSCVSCHVVRVVSSRRCVGGVGQWL
jgi:hypothetical protein